MKRLTSFHRARCWCWQVFDTPRIFALFRRTRSSNKGKHAASDRCAAGICTATWASPCVYIWMRTEEWLFPGTRAARQIKASAAAIQRSCIARYTPRQQSDLGNPSATDHSLWRRASMYTYSIFNTHYFHRCIYHYRRSWIALLGIVAKRIACSPQSRKRFFEPSTWAMDAYNSCWVYRW